jgi:hypothetical protein
MSKVYAIYNDDDILMDAVKQTRAAHHHIEEVFYPSRFDNGPCAYQTSYLFVHIRLYWYFIYMMMMNYIMIQDWPQDIGGKPSFSYIENMPAFAYHV